VLRKQDALRSTCEVQANKLREGLRQVNPLVVRILRRTTRRMAIRRASYRTRRVWYKPSST
jgi:hypothetical protein